MKKRVWGYFKANPVSSSLMCANALEEKHLESMEVCHELSREGYLRRIVAPLGNGIEPDNSEFYSVSKTYKE
jgi:hypothetical protein